MNSTRRALIKLAVGLAAASVWPTLARAAEARKPKVILIITDDQGYGDFGFNGNDKIRTPNLDRFASQSVQFSRYYVSPVCAPTRACLLTGRYNHRTGAIDTFLGRAMMHSDEVTLSEVLKSAGYRTGISGKWHLGDNCPMRPQDQGFDDCLTLRGGGIGQPSDPPGGEHYMDPVLFRNGKAEKFKGYVTDIIADNAIRFVGENRERPFFLHVAFNAPHTPLEVPEDWVKPYRGKGLDDTTAKVYAMVENIDRNIGRMLQKLDELKLDEQTIVLFMTDNGPQQKRFNAGMRGLKGSVYDGGIRVPLWARWTGKLTPGRRVEHLAAHIDIMPTLLELCGVEPPNVKVDGMSLAPLMLGQKVEWVDRTLFIQWHRGDEPIAYKNAAVRTNKWKLVDGKELYDMQQDPGETREVAKAHPAIVAELRGRYEAWFADVTAGRRYQPPRILIGTPLENPITLTRQDWRGPRAGWGKDSLGFWEVEVARGGKYEVTLRFAAAPEDGQVVFRLFTARHGNVARNLVVKRSANSLVMELLELPEGPGRLEIAVVFDGRPIGVQQAELKLVR